MVVTYDDKLSRRGTEKRNGIFNVFCPSNILVCLLLNVAIFRDIVNLFEICLRFSTSCGNLCSSYRMRESHARCVRVDRSVTSNFQKGS